MSLERATGFEPADDGLGSHCLTTWRCPHCVEILSQGEKLARVFGQTHVIAMSITGIGAGCLQTATSYYPAFVQLKAVIIQAKSKLAGVESSPQQKGE